MLPNLFYKVSISSLPKSDKGITHTHKENDKPLSLMSIKQKFTTKY